MEKIPTHNNQLYGLYNNNNNNNTDSNYNYNYGKDCCMLTDIPMTTFVILMKACIESSRDNIFCLLQETTAKDCRLLKGIMMMIILLMKVCIESSRDNVLSSSSFGFFRG